MYYGMVGIVIFATLAMAIQHGIWNNLVNLISIVFAGVIAYGVHQPIVVFVDEQSGGEYTYLLDYPVLWGVFAFAVLLIKAFANLLSKNQVNFPEKVDQIGGGVVGLVTGYVLACFLMSTFYAAPLAEDPLGDGGYSHGSTVKAVQKRMDESAVIAKPDFAWLSLCGSMLAQAAYGSDGFNPAIFVQQQTKHRAAFEALDRSVVRRK